MRTLFCFVDIDSPFLDYTLDKKQINIFIYRVFVYKTKLKFLVVVFTIVSMVIIIPYLYLLLKYS